MMPLPSAQMPLSAAASSPLPAVQGCTSGLSMQDMRLQAADICRRYLLCPMVRCRWRPVVSAGSVEWFTWVDRVRSHMTECSSQTVGTPGHAALMPANNGGRGGARGYRSLEWLTAAGIDLRPLAVVLLRGSVAQLSSSPHVQSLFFPRANPVLSTKPLTNSEMVQMSLAAIFDFLFPQPPCALRPSGIVYVRGLRKWKRGRNKLA